MDKQAQDKLWNELSEETQKQYREDYSILCNEHPIGEFRTGEIRGIIITMENLFGSHNLNPKPQIKTWEDIEKTNINWSNIDIDRLNTLDAITPKMRNKLIATYKIAKLIDLGYGGMVSEEEWKDEEIIKFGVKWSYKANDWVYHNYQTTKHFIAFHTPEQREEFMSHESNKRLVEQYYMM